MTTGEPSAASLREVAELSHAWPFEEARKIVARLKSKPKDEVIFETGYGPSGLPHIGTFGEVARTTMVRHAFRVLTDDKIKTRLIAFSDDMDGLRKVPDNVPNKDMVAAHLGKPLTQVPDPFGTHDEFRRAQQCAAARLSRPVRLRLRVHVVDRLLHVGAVRRRAVADVLRISKKSWRSCCRRCAKSARRLIRRFCRSTKRPESSCRCRSSRTMPKAGTITYENGFIGKERVTTPVTGGRCKLQWKPDWAMRWVALGVDYEMAGKDLIELGQAVRRNLPRAGRCAAGRVQLRAVPR